MTAATDQNYFPTVQTSNYSQWWRRGHIRRHTVPLKLCLSVCLSVCFKSEKLPYKRRFKAVDRGPAHVDTLVLLGCVIGVQFYHMTHDTVFTTSTPATTQVLLSVSSCVCLSVCLSVCLYAHKLRSCRSEMDAV